MKSIQSYVRGGKHISNDIPCEDRTFSLTKNQVMSIALADGAGNQKYTHSAQGAECVTKVATNFLCDNFDNFYAKEDEDELKKVFITVLRKALSALKEELELDSIARLSSTVLAVAVKGNKYIACHLGDGMIGALKVTGTEPFSLPNNGEFANETYFVPSPGAEENLKIKKGIVEDILAFFLMSDGTADYIYDDYEKKFSPAALKMTGMLFEQNGSQKLRETIEKYIIEPNSTSDDCSFIVMQAQSITPEVKMALFGASSDSGEERTSTTRPNSKFEFVSIEPDKNVSENVKEVNLNKEKYNKVNSNGDRIVTQYTRKEISSRKREKAIISIISVLCFLVAIAIVLVLLLRNEKPEVEISKPTPTAAIVEETIATEEPESTPEVETTPEVTDEQTSTPGGAGAMTTDGENLNTDETSTSESKPTDENSPSPSAESSPSNEPKPAVEPSPASKPGPKAEPSPEVEPSPVIEPSPAAEPSPVIEPSPVVESSPEVEPSPLAEPSPSKEP